MKKREMEMFELRKAKLIKVTIHAGLPFEEKYNISDTVLEDLRAWLRWIEKHVAVEKV